MTIRALIQTNSAIMGIDGESYAYLAGDFDGNDTDILATTPYGNLAIPRSNIALMFALRDDVVFPESDLIWRIN